MTLRTLTREQFVEKLRRTGLYTPVQARALWVACMEYQKKVKELAELRSQLEDMVATTQDTIQVPGIRVTYNNPRTIYDWVSVCEEYGVDYTLPKYVVKYDARKAFCDAFVDRPDTLDDKFKKKVPVKPSITLREDAD